MIRLLSDVWMDAALSWLRVLPHAIAIFILLAAPIWFGSFILRRNSVRINDQHDQMFQSAVTTLLVERIHLTGDLDSRIKSLSRVQSRLTFSFHAIMGPAFGLWPMKALVALFGGVYLIFAGSAPSGVGNAILLLVSVASSLAYFCIAVQWLIEPNLSLSLLLPRLKTDACRVLIVMFAGASLSAVAVVVMITANSWSASRIVLPFLELTMLPIAAILYSACLANVAFCCAEGGRILPASASAFTLVKRNLAVSIVAYGLAGLFLSFVYGALSNFALSPILAGLGMSRVVGGPARDIVYAILATFWLSLALRLRERLAAMSLREGVRS